MGPATIVGTLPEEIGTSLGFSKNIYWWGEVFFNYSNAQNIDDRHMIEKCLNFSSSL